MSSAFSDYEKYETEKLRPRLANHKNKTGLPLYITDENGSASSKGITLIYPKAGKSTAEALSALKKAAEAKNISGIVLNFKGVENPQPLIEAAQSLIPASKWVATIADAQTALLPFMKNSALLLEGSEIEIRETLARTGLSKRYEKARIYVNTNGSLLKCAEGWHAYSVTGSEMFGPKIALRRITYPKQLSSGGAFPVRIWLQNTGTSAEYSALAVKMFIEAKSHLYEIPLKSKLKGLMQGDATVNEIAVLPSLPSGEYSLWCGVYVNKSPLTLANDCKEKNGLYCIGKVKLDTEKRDELFSAWSNYYPEGYYPLEDPKLPY